MARTLTSHGVLIRGADVILTVSCPSTLVSEVGHRTPDTVAVMVPNPVMTTSIGSVPFIRMVLRSVEISAGTVPTSGMFWILNRRGKLVHAGQVHRERVAGLNVLPHDDAVRAFIAHIVDDECVAASWEAFEGGAVEFLDDDLTLAPAICCGKDQR